LAQDSSGGGLKFMVGCGCLLLLAGIIGVIAIAALGAGGWFVAKKAADEAEKLAVEAEKVKVVQEKLTEELEKTKEAALAEKEALAEKDARVISRQEFLSWPTLPLSVDEARAHQAFMKEWKGSEAVSLLAKGKSLESFAKKQDASAFDKLEALGNVKDIAFGAGPARDELDKMSKTHGGADKVFERYYKLLAVCAAADGVARDGKKKMKLSSDEVADRMIELHPEAEKRFADWESLYIEQYRRAQRIAQDPEVAKKSSQDKTFQEDMKRLGQVSTVMSQKPGVFLLGKLPASSLIAWRALDEKERAEISKTFKETPFLPAFTMGQGEVDFEVAAKQLLAIQSAQVFFDSQQKIEGKPEP
jgi:hypothetical protein